MKCTTGLILKFPQDRRGDALDRYNVRFKEMQQSCRIIDQALDHLPGGDFIAKKVPQKLSPPRVKSIPPLKAPAVCVPITW